MAYNIRKNWIESLQLMITRPIVMLPFIIIAFLEGLSLELIYFSSRRPLSYLVSPIIRKFFGEAFLRYPGNLIILPKAFYFAQTLIYIFIGVALVSISVNIVKNIRLELPLKRNSMIRNALGHYVSFFGFGILVIAVMVLLNRTNMFVFFKIINLVGKHIPPGVIKVAPFVLSFCAFLANIIMQTFLVLVVPIIVLKKKSMFKALWESITLAFRNFFTIFPLIFLPFLIYLPITLLNTNMLKLIEKTSPEINLYLTVTGIILTVFLECFIIVCATGFLMDKEGSNIKK